MKKKVQLPIVQGHVRKKVSHSEWGCWKVCQARWYLRYVMGNFEKIEGIHMNFGTAVHSGIEALLCRDVSKRVPLAEAKDRVRAGFREMVEGHFRAYDERERLQFGTEASGYTEPDLLLVEIMADAGVRIIEDLSKLPEVVSAQVVWNERKVTQPMERTDGFPILFNGALDMAVIVESKRGQKKYLWIVDFKTCGWGWDGKKRRDPHILAQLLLYKHFICKELSMDPKVVHTAFVLLKKRPPKGQSAAEWFPISSGPKAVSNAIDELQSDITAMREAVACGDVFAETESCGDVEKKDYLCQFYYDDRCPVSRAAGRRKPAPTLPSTSVSP